MTLGPYSNIPPGVRISTYAWCLHRNEDVFPDAEKFIPVRWLHRGKEQAEVMERWFWAFGSGSRMCLGRNLAMEMIRYAVAAIYTGLETVVVRDEGASENKGPGEGGCLNGEKSDELVLGFKLIN